MPDAPAAGDASAYAELEGYGDFVERHSSDMTAYAGLRDDEETQKFLRAHVYLALENGHVSRWFYLRHVELERRGGKEELLRAEARQCNLLDMVCDAANNAYSRKHPGTAFASSKAEMELAAREGMQMAFLALLGPTTWQTPPGLMKMRDQFQKKVSARAREPAHLRPPPPLSPHRLHPAHPSPSGVQVDHYIAGVKQRAKWLEKEELVRKSVGDARRKQERDAEAAARAQEQGDESAGGALSFRVIAMLVGLLAIMFAMGGGGR